MFGRASGMIGISTDDARPNPDGTYSVSVSLREANAVDDIARSRGWNPLMIGEEMTVHFDDKEYRIQRTK